MSQEQYQEWVNSVCGCSEVMCFDPGPGGREVHVAEKQRRDFEGGMAGDSARGTFD